MGKRKHIEEMWILVVYPVKVCVDNTNTGPITGPLLSGQLDLVWSEDWQHAVMSNVSVHARGVCKLLWQQVVSCDKREVKILKEKQ